ncbi:unnamed protein product, partial [Cuscuta epithymum]
MGHDLNIERVTSFREPLFFHGELTRILCSCNGVVLVAAGQNVLLWNPITRWCRVVLKHRSLRNPGNSVLGGICYDSSTKDYKFVFFISRESGFSGRALGGFVFSASLQNNKAWTLLSFPYNSYSPRSGVNFNNTFHWRVSDVKRPCALLKPHQHDYSESDSTGLDDYSESHSCGFDSDEDGSGWVWDNSLGCNNIAYFDPINEEFKTLPSPDPCNTEEEDSIVGLGIIDDCLCMARTDDKMQMVQVLIMKECGKRESWFKAFDIPMSKFEKQDDFYDIKLFSKKGNNAKVLIISGQKIAYIYDSASEDVLSQVCL